MVNLTHQMPTPSASRYSSILFAAKDSALIKPANSGTITSVSTTSTAASNASCTNITVAGMTSTSASAITPSVYGVTVKPLSISSIYHPRMHIFASYVYRKYYCHYDDIIPSDCGCWSPPTDEGKSTTQLLTDAFEVSGSSSFRIGRGNCIIRRGNDDCGCWSGATSSSNNSSSTIGREGWRMLIDIYKVNSITANKRIYRCVYNFAHLRAALSTLSSSSVDGLRVEETVSFSNSKAGANRDISSSFVGPAKLIISFSVSFNRLCAKGSSSCKISLLNSSTCRDRINSTANTFFTENTALSAKMNSNVMDSAGCACNTNSNDSSTSIGSDNSGGSTIDGKDQNSRNCISYGNENRTNRSDINITAVVAPPVILSKRSSRLPRVMRLTVVRVRNFTYNIGKEIGADTVGGVENDEEACANGVYVNVLYAGKSYVSHIYNDNSSKKDLANSINIEYECLIPTDSKYVNTVGYQGLSAISDDKRATDDERNRTAPYDCNTKRNESIYIDIYGVSYTVEKGNNLSRRYNESLLFPDTGIRNIAKYKFQNSTDNNNNVITSVNSINHYGWVEISNSEIVSIFTTINQLYNKNTDEDVVVSHGNSNGGINSSNDNINSKGTHSAASSNCSSSGGCSSSSSRRFRSSSSSESGNNCHSNNDKGNMGMYTRTYTKRMKQIRKEHPIHDDSRNNNHKSIMLCRYTPCIIEVRLSTIPSSGRAVPASSLYSPFHARCPPTFNTNASKSLHVTNSQYLDRYVVRSSASAGSVSMSRLLVNTSSSSSNSSNGTFASSRFFMNDTRIKDLLEVTDERGNIQLWHNMISPIDPVIQRCADRNGIPLLSLPSSSLLSSTSALSSLLTYNTIHSIHQFIRTIPYTLDSDPYGDDRLIHSNALVINQNRGNINSHVLLYMNMLLGINAHAFICVGTLRSSTTTSPPDDQCSGGSSIVNDGGGKSHTWIGIIESTANIPRNTAYNDTTSNRDINFNNDTGSSSSISITSLCLRDPALNLVYELSSNSDIPKNGIKRNKHDRNNSNSMRRTKDNIHCNKNIAGELSTPSTFNIREYTLPATTNTAKCNCKSNCRSSNNDDIEYINAIPYKSIDIIITPHNSYKNIQTTRSPLDVNYAYWDPQLWQPIGHNVDGCGSTSVCTSLTDIMQHMPLCLSLPLYPKTEARQLQKLILQYLKDKRRKLGLRDSCIIYNANNAVLRKCSEGLRILELSDISANYKLMFNTWSQRFTFSNQVLNNLCSDEQHNEMDANLYETYERRVNVRVLKWGYLHSPIRDPYEIALEVSKRFQFLLYEYVCNHNDNNTNSSDSSVNKYNIANNNTNIGSSGAYNNTSISTGSSHNRTTNEDDRNNHDAHDKKDNGGLDKSSNNTRTKNFRSKCTSCSDTNSTSLVDGNDTRVEIVVAVSLRIHPCNQKSIYIMAAAAVVSSCSGDRESDVLSSREITPNRYRKRLASGTGCSNDGSNTSSNNSCKSKRLCMLPCTCSSNDYNDICDEKPNENCSRRLSAAAGGVRGLMQKYCEALLTAPPLLLVRYYFTNCSSNIDSSICVYDNYDNKYNDCGNVENGGKSDGSGKKESNSSSDNNGQSQDNNTHGNIGCDVPIIATIVYTAANTYNNNSITDDVFINSHNNGVGVLIPPTPLRRSIARFREFDNMRPDNDSTLLAAL